MRSIYFLRRSRGLSTRFAASTCFVARAIFKLRFDRYAKKRLFSGLKKGTSNLVMQPEIMLNKTMWDPLNVFHHSADYKYAVVILNCPIEWKQSVLLRMWKTAEVTVTVDGGTHRWLEYLEKQAIDLLSGKHNEYLPDLITGDMDSSVQEVITKLESMGSIVIKTPDQSKTDYTKALMELNQHCKLKDININGIHVFVGTSGRLDHIVGNINTLYKSDKIVGNRQVIQIASDSLTWILRPGFHKIEIPEVLVKHSSWCGLLPIGAPVKCITTTGLKWNLNKSFMQFGGLVSSSNTYDKSSEVTVSTDTTTVWTMGIEPLKETVSNNASF